MKESEFNGNYNSARACHQWMLYRDCKDFNPRIWANRGNVDGTASFKGQNGNQSSPAERLSSYLLGPLSN